MPHPWKPLGLLALTAGLSAAVAQDPVEPPLPVRPVPLGKAKMSRPAVVGGAPTGMPAAAAAEAVAVSDDDALKQAGLSPDDGPKLVDYLKRRTVSDADRGKIQGLIGRFRADGFDDRIAAAAEVERYGPAAIGPLKGVESDPDPEVAYRAGQLLARLSKVPHQAVAAAAVRGVVRLKPAGATATLLGFLPLADSDQLADEIRDALVPLAVAGDKPDPAVLAALTDASAARRGAAYAALAEGGPGKGRARTPLAADQLVAAVRKEDDPDARFRGLWALSRTARGKEFVPDLIALTPTLPRGRLWQVEDLLLQLAGEHPPGGRFGKGEDALAKARDAWAGWWAKAGPAADLATLPDAPRVQGVLDLVEHELNGFGTGRVSSVGPDGRERWQFPSRQGNELRVGAGGRVLAIEGSNQVVERDPTGRTVHTQTVNQPVAVRPLAGGGTLVIGRPVAIEYDAQWQQVWAITRPGDIMGGCRLPNGDTLLVTHAQQGANLLQLDGKGKEVGKPPAVGRLRSDQQTYVTLDPVGDDRVLLTEPGQVGEYDLKTGKLVWKYAVPMPTSAQRLHNGNTLIAVYNANRVIEVDPAGEIVWEQPPKEKLRVARAYRR